MQVFVYTNNFYFCTCRSELIWIPHQSTRFARMVFRSACAYTEGPGLTFRQALALGGHVRKGEKGTTVVYADPSALWLAPAAGPRVAGDPELIPFRPPSFDLEELASDLRVEDGVIEPDELDRLRSLQLLAPRLVLDAQLRAVGFQISEEV